MTASTVHATPITLTVDSTQVATSSDALRSGTSSTLDGLTIKWGRTSRLDQPQPATLTATVAVPEVDASRVLDLLTPGKRIVATATTPWSSKPLPYSYITSSLWMPRGAGESTDLAPGPIQPSLTNPTAWDKVPRFSPDRAIKLTFTLTTQVSSLTLVVAPIYYSAPWAESGTIDTQRAITITNPPSGTFTITSLGTADRSIGLDPRRVGSWVGFRVTATINGARFVDERTRFSDSQRRWQDYNGLVMTRAVIETTTSPTRTSTIFSGRIAAAPISYDEALKTARVTLECNDWTVDLENKKIGDNTFTPEATSARLTRILALCPGVQVEPLSPATSARRLASRDVDAQKPMDLLRELAASNDAILWPLAHTTRGEYFKFEDQDTRKSLYRLTWDPGTGNATPQARPHQGIVITARAITRGGFTVDRDLSDLATVARVTYKTTDAAGKQHDIDAVATAPEREREYGTRELRVSTWLDRKEDAEALATALLNRTGPGGWIITGSQVTSAHPAMTGDTLASLLDDSTRAGLAVTLTDLPPWVPGNPNVPVYLDGGTYKYSKGTWTLDLTLTRAATSGGAVAWGQLPTRATWARMGTLTFADIASLTS